MTNKKFSEYVSEQSDLTSIGDGVIPVVNSDGSATKGKITKDNLKNDIKMSDAEVKTAYENNADTNAYTDAEKNKLAGIEAQATKNQSDSYLLDRTNHTGTQTASTISDFDTAVSNNSDVSVNTNKRHDPVTVTDTDDIDLTLTGQDIKADLKSNAISNKTAKTVTGSEEILINDGGTLKKTTAQEIADLGGSGINNVKEVTLANNNILDWKALTGDDNRQVTIFKFNDDGTKAIGYISNGENSLVSLTFSTAFDITTASVSTKKTISASGSNDFYVNTNNLYVSPDGTKLFIARKKNNSNSNSYGIKIYKYTLSTAWDVSTAGNLETKELWYVDNSVNTNQPYNVYWTNDGLKCTIVLYYSTILEFTTDSAFNISNLSFNRDVTKIIREVISVVQNKYNGWMSFYTRPIISQDGTKVIIASSGMFNVYKLNTPYDLSSITNDNIIMIQPLIQFTHDTKTLNFNSQGYSAAVLEANNKLYITHMHNYLFQTDYPN